MTAAITSWDLSVLLYIQNNIRSDFWTPFWQFISFLGNGGWFGIALCVILLFPQKTRHAGFTALIAILFTFIMGEGVIKHLVNRPRPYEASAEIIPLMAKLTSSSFPSGHTANAFAYSLTLGHYLPRKASIPLVILACLTGFSRIYLGMHYTTDVLAGCLLGMVVSFLTVRAAEKIRSRRENKAEKAAQVQG